MDLNNLLRTAEQQSQAQHAQAQAMNALAAQQERAIWMQAAISVAGALIRSESAGFSPVALADSSITRELLAKTAFDIAGALIYEAADRVTSAARRSELAGSPIPPWSPDKI